MSIKLYELGRSRSSRIRWMLNEAGIPFESIPVKVGPNADPAFLKISPLGKVPVIQDGDLVLRESAAIATYIADQVPEKNLVPPPRTRERALYDQWMSFIITELDAPLWVIAKNTFLYPEEKRTPVAIEMARDDFKRVAAVWERELGNKSFMLGETFSALDVMAGQIAIWANIYHLIDGFPGLQAYLKRVTARPAFPKDIYEQRS